MTQQPMERCDNCLKQYPESKIATHFGYCKRNIKCCQQCGQMYDINFQEQHEEEFHKMSPCRFCKKEFKPSQVSMHEQRCPQKTKFCQYCQLNVPIKDYEAHLRACQARTKLCQKCRKPISNKDFLVHSIQCTGIQENPILQTVQPQKEYKSYNQYVDNYRKEENWKPTPKSGVHEPKKDAYSKRNVVEQKPITSKYAQLNYNNAPSNKDIKSTINREYQAQTRNTEQYKYRNDSHKVRQQKPKINHLGVKNPSTSSKTYGTGNRQSHSNNYGMDRDSKGPRKEVIGIPEIRKEPASKISANKISINNSKKPYDPKKPEQNKYVFSKKQIQSKNIQQQHQLQTKFTYKRQIPYEKQPTSVYNRKAQHIYKPKNSYQDAGRHNYQPDKLHKYQYQDERFVTPQDNFGNHGFDSQRGFEEDEQLQKIIFASISSNMASSKNNTYQAASKRVYQPPKQSSKIDEIPPELLEGGMINQQIYDKQKAIYEEIERNKKRR